MPRLRPGEKHVLVRMPVATFERVRARADAGYRSLNKEILMIIDTHLKSEDAGSAEPASNEERV